MILVTGGAGLLGSALIEQLVLEGKKVRAIYNSTPLDHIESPLVEKMHCDILDVMGLEEAMKGIDQVYHCAAIISFNPTKKNELFKTNIEGTANIVNTALEQGISKLLFVSSVAALGREASGSPVNETMNFDEDKDHSLYGKSKYMAELEVWRGIGEGLSAVIVNPVIIIGAGDWNKGSTRIFQSVYDEFPWYSNGTNGFVDVRDAVQAMISLMDSDIQAQRFILCGANRSYQQVFDFIASSFGKKRPHKAITPLLASLVWRWEAIKCRFTKKEPLVTRETAATALSRISYDNSKLLNHLTGFSYRPLEESIQFTCSALQQKINKQ